MKFVGAALLGLIGLGVLALLPARRVAISESAPATLHARASARQVARGPEPAPAPVAAPAPAPLAERTATPDESAFMRDLRVLAELDPELAIERAHEASTRFGASADAPERRSILIHALARMGLASEARGEAERMVNECPDSNWVREIERFTGAHRHRNIRLAENGQLEYW